MNKTLILLGIGCIVVGVLWPWLRTLPFGRLPGDILIVRDNVRFFFPVTTCIVVSLVLTIVLWLFRK
ncbi:MAG: DUF2905 domain-containing protein [Desulfobulbus sp.]|jgi:hypothetical protein|uniref:DUF2905 domain-containing protein n=1 Tax=Desulfobulbus sp. TaxID=895 RepID=UPI0028483102|nr:DUF2905 domain-containing protein [Desulfobulbus sp.]MDR2550691.1 DUF2905 domain-containing protein [Desulfobulbus sp.]